LEKGNRLRGGANYGGPTVHKKQLKGTFEKRRGRGLGPGCGGGGTGVGHENASGATVPAKLTVIGTNVCCAQTERNDLDSWL